MQVDTKIIHIPIPGEKTIPEIVHTFTPAENYLMLLLGAEALTQGRKFATQLTSEQAYKKVESDFLSQIEELERAIAMEKKSSQQMQQNLVHMYEMQVKDLWKRLELAIAQTKKYENEHKMSVIEEVDKAKEKYDVMFREKEKQVERLTEAYEKMLVQQKSSKSTSYKGSEGEKQFEDYAQTFIDFKGFQMADKHTQGGEGDFHLHFEEFDVLVDAKNYKKKVPIDQREKIKKDLQKNEHIHFGWLVSLNTSIDKFDRAPIMYEWVNTNQCLVYINNLLSFEDPAKILRIVWFTCKELHKIVADNNFDEEELVKLREQRYMIMDKLKALRKHIREVNTSMNATRNLVQLMDDQLKEILDTETTSIVDSCFSVFDEWWAANILTTTESTLVLSTDIWFKFRQDNKDLIKQFEITPEKFKQFVKSKVPLTSIIMKSKNANAAFDIKGIALNNKNDIALSSDDHGIEVELNEASLKKKTTKSGKSKVVSD